MWHLTAWQGLLGKGGKNGCVFNLTAVAGLILMRNSTRESNKGRF